MTPARLERATFGLGTPGTGSQAFPILPCSLESGEIRLNPPGCFSQSFPVFPHRHPKYIQSRGDFSGFSVFLCFRAKFGQSGTQGFRLHCSLKCEQDGPDQGANAPWVWILMRRRAPALCRRDPRLQLRRVIPSVLMRERRVLGATPRRLAALPSPLIFQSDSSSARRILARSTP